MQFGSEQRDRHLCPYAIMAVPCGSVLLADGMVLLYHVLAQTHTACGGWRLAEQIRASASRRLARWSLRDYNGSLSDTRRWCANILDRGEK
jgi:hypothetical protein